MEQSSDGGPDFEYVDQDGQSSWIELKLTSRPESKKIRSEWRAQIERYSKYSGRRIELWVLDRRGAVLSIWSQPSEHPDVFSLAEIVSTDRSATVEELGKEPITSPYIEARAHHWIAQVSHLFEEVAQWVESLNCVARQLPAAPMSEELMQKFGVPPLPINIMTISRKKTVVATLVPVALWVIGANGRVDLLTPKESFILINTAKYPKDAKWAIVSNRSPRQPVELLEFNRNFLSGLLSGDEAI